MKHNRLPARSNNGTKKRAVLLLCALITITGALVSTKSTFRGRAQNADAAQPHSPLPEHVAYEFLFRRQAFAKQRAEELERQGKNPKDLRSMIKDEVKLSDEQATKFDEVASVCLQEAKDLDDSAQQIIKAARDRYPGGRVPRGEKAPPVPHELTVMQQQRDAIFQRGRGRLQATLGEQGFRQLDKYIKIKLIDKAQEGAPAR